MLTTTQIQHRLIGTELGTVCFVRDYVELFFDYDRLRALANPRVREADGAVHEFPQPGSRDALCALIGATVVSVTIEEQKSFEVELSNGSIISVPLDRSAELSGESLHFVPSGETGDPLIDEMVIL